MRINSINNLSANNNYELSKPRALAEVPTESTDTSSNPNFGSFSDTISRLYGDAYGKKMYNNKKLLAISKSLTKVPGTMTEHMATLGSALTSGVYVYKTLNNKNLEQDNKQKLAINQFFCFLVPTIAAYFVNSKLAGFNKKMEYRYAGLKEQQKALGKLSEEEVAVLTKEFGRKLKAFKPLAALFTFTLIYRYLTPVAVTPLANFLGDKLIAHKNKKNAAAEQQNVKPAVA